MNSECPAEAGEVAEELSLGRLSPDKAAAFEAHMRGCEKCRQAYEETVRFIEGIRGAGDSGEFRRLKVALITSLAWLGPWSCKYLCFGKATNPFLAYPNSYIIFVVYSKWISLEKGIA